MPETYLSAVTVRITKSSSWLPGFRDAGSQVLADTNTGLPRGTRTVVRNSCNFIPIVSNSEITCPLGTARGQKRNALSVRYVRCERIRVLLECGNELCHS